MVNKWQEGYKVVLATRKTRTKEAVTAIKRMPERTRFMKGIFAWVGFPSYTLFFDRPHRKAKLSTDPPKRLRNQAIRRINQLGTNQNARKQWKRENIITLALWLRTLCFVLKS